MAALLRIVIAVGLRWLAGGVAGARTKRVLIVCVGDDFSVADGDGIRIGPCTSRDTLRIAGYRDRPC